MSDKKRVMWLLNHTSARKFEIPMLKACGVDEIFLPKSFPADPTFRSASIDWSEDENLTIPKEDLDILNACDWYTGATPEAWKIANKWFDVVFFIAYDARLIINLTKYFHGIIIYRVYGLSSDINYGKLLNFITEGKIANYLRRLGNRFIFGMAYDNLSNQEPDFLKRRAVYL
ncbi:glycosytransferase, partial [Escherichia coli]|nr:glycosytransferase [Escherichia coli]